MGVGLDIDLRPMLRQLTDGLDEARLKLVPKAKAIALSRVGVTLRKEAQIKIREKLAIKAAVARNALTIIKVDGQVLIIRASGKPIPLRDYGAKATKKGVSYKVSKSRGRQIYSNKYGKSFIVASIGRNVFVRTSDDPKGPRKARITKLYGPSLGNAFNSAELQARLKRLAQERFGLEFQRAVNALVGGR